MLKETTSDTNEVMTTDEFIGAIKDGDLVQFELRDMDLDNIDRSPVQPDGRDDEERKLRDLMRNVLNTKTVVPPFVARKGANQNQRRHEVLDGHRRIKVARMLGLTKLQVLVPVKTLSPEIRNTMFGNLNFANSNLAGNQRVQAWARTPQEHKEAFLGTMKPGQRRQIEDLIDIVGVRQVVEWAEQGHAIASLARCTRQVSKWCTGWALNAPNDIAVANWIVTHKMSRTVDSVARNPTRQSATAIVNHIHQNKPYATKK